MRASRGTLVNDLGTESGPGAPLSAGVTGPRPAPAGRDDGRELRVLMVTAAVPSTDRPGHGPFIMSQIESLAGVGVRTTVHHVVGRPGWKYLTGMREIRRLARSGRFDLVHGHYGFCGFVARAQWTVPVIVSFCGDDVLGTPDAAGRPIFRSRIEVLSNQLLSQIVDGIIVKSAQMRRVLWPTRRAMVRVIPNGVDLALFRPIPRDQARRRLGLDPAVRYVLFPADPAIPRKAFPIVQAAVDLLRREGLAVELLAVHRSTQAELRDYYSAVDAVALPSYWEGSPNVVKEAMACNAPIVAAACGDVREVIGTTPGCAIVERTPAAFADGLRVAFGQPGGRTDGRERIAHLALEAVAGRVRDVYTAVLAGRQLRGRRALEAR